METDTRTTQPAPGTPKSRSAWIVAAVVVIVVVAVALAIQFASSAEAETGDVKGQGGRGVWAIDGVTLVRFDDGVEVSMQVPRPQPGTYEYPPAETPSGGYHPPVSQGEEEVFTMWLFNFNHPELCKDPYVCRDVDISGENGVAPAAEGGVYRVDGVVVSGEFVTMKGTVLVGSPAAVGADMTNPLCSHVHVAMAPHGQALEGDDLLDQLNTSIGGTDWWWAALFEFIDAEKGCTPQPR